MATKTLFAGILAAALVFLLAACGGEPTVEAGAAQAIATELVTEAAAEESTTEGAASEEITTAEAATTQADDSPAIPADLAGIIRYYNEALAKTPMQRTHYKRRMTKITGFAKALGLTILDDPDLQDNPDVMPYVYAEDNAIRPSDLVALEADWAASASSTLNGGEAIVIIVLKDYPASPALDPKPGVLGYVSTLDSATVEPLVCDVSMALASAVISPNALREVNVTYSSYGLSDGKYNAAIDTATGKIKSLAFTASQQVEGTAKCVLNIPLIPASANADVTLQGNLAAAYAPK